MIIYVYIAIKLTKFVYQLLGARLKKNEKVRTSIHMNKLWEAI